MDIKTFETGLKKFGTWNAKSMELAAELSMAALEHFQEHGDTAWLKRFHDAMPKNYLRRDAFIAWAVEFSPVYLKDGNWKKDTSPDAVEFDLKGAAKKPFWEFKPAQEIINFGHEDVIKKFRRVLKTLRNDRHVTTDPIALADLDRADAFISQLEKENAQAAAGVTEAETEATEEGEEEPLPEGVAKAAA